MARDLGRAAGGRRHASERSRACRLGIGMSNEIDSRMAAQTLMWAFGAAVQDENENVIINSPETIAAVEYMAELFKETMTPEVFGWNAASNNQLLDRWPGVLHPELYLGLPYGAGGSARRGGGYLLPHAAGRTGGEEAALAHGHAVFNSRSRPTPQNQDTAKEFLLHLVGNYEASRRAEQALQLPGLAETRARSVDRRRLARRGSVRVRAARQAGDPEDCERLDDQSRSSRSGQRRDGRDLRLARSSEHDGARRPRRADRRRSRWRRPSRRSTRSSRHWRGEGLVGGGRLVRHADRCHSELVEESRSALHCCIDVVSRQRSRRHVLARRDRS